ncbi:MAG: DUF4861 domain-containing protein [Bacteroidales bacterium]|nr:DUF4861 domain-containing protein [Bacteroidales bacterium]
MNRKRHTKISPVKAIGFGLIILLLQGCGQDRFYKISNPGNGDIADLAVVIERLEVNRYIIGTSTNVPVVVRDKTGELLPSQCDDIDGDGRWDELAFLVNIKAGETKKVSFDITDTLPAFPARTNIRFGRMEYPFEEVTGDLRLKTNDTKYSAPVYQMEGPAWENDIIAFRNYYDARNGIDIFGKRTAEMVLDSVGVNGRDYHTLAGWGMDNLKVGNSLGAGAIAIGIGDSLYRVGPCEEGRYRFICEGPVRAVFELIYEGVPAGDRSYNLKHQVSIYAGDLFYRSKVWVENLQGDEELVTGIVNLHNVSSESFNEGSMNILYSLGNQGISGEVLGMGILLPAGQFKRFWEAPLSGNGIVNTHLVSLELKKDIPAEYYFLAAWEMYDPQVQDKDYFIQMLKSAAEKIGLE